MLEETRVNYRFVVVGYVIMPEHFHLLISEPQVGDPSTVLQVLKQRYAQRILRRREDVSEQVSFFDKHASHVWQARFYDFNVWTERKRIESCATCIGIRSNEDLYWKRNSGPGAASVGISGGREERSSSTIRAL